MTFSDISQKIRRFFRLRPGVSWSLFSFILLILLISTVRWENRIDRDDFKDLYQFNVVELALPESRAEADIVLPEENLDDLYEKSFGDSSGDFQDIDNRATAPKPLFTRFPEYPVSMREAGIEGLVTIELGIDRSGNVVYGIIQRSLGKVFDLAVIKWAKNLQFYPATGPDGNPFKCRIILPVRFKLD